MGYGMVTGECLAVVGFVMGYLTAQGGTMVGSFTKIHTVWKMVGGPGTRGGVEWVVVASLHKKQRVH